MAAVGSSKKTSFGRPIKVKTNEKRRFCPPDNFSAKFVLFAACQTAIVDRSPGCSRDLDKYFERKQSTL